MSIIDSLLVGLFLFGKNIVGIVTRPYETYRALVSRSNIWELFPLGVVLMSYFAIASLVRTAAFRPFLLTKQFLVLASATGATYIAMIFLLHFFANRLGGNGNRVAIGVGWAYSLVPTFVWFMMTALLSVLLPPPRTLSVPGISFSILFLVLSVVILYWKLMLGYLTLRFSMKLDFPRIVCVGLAILPFLAVYSVFMYRMGVFRVPFV